MNRLCKHTQWCCCIHDFDERQGWSVVLCLHPTKAAAAEHVQQYNDARQSCENGWAELLTLSETKGKDFGSAPIELKKLYF